MALLNDESQTAYTALAEAARESRLGWVLEQVEERILQLKSMLRQGDDKKAFEQAQTLLHGYLAVQKVIQRVNRKLF